MHFRIVLESDIPHYDVLSAHFRYFFNFFLYEIKVSAKEEKQRKEKKKNCIGCQFDLHF